jgi:hypothetical protein
MAMYIDIAITSMRAVAALGVYRTTSKPLTGTGRTGRP